MKIIIALACVLAIGLSASTDNDDEWETFKKTYGKTYANDDSEAARKNNYFQNKDKIDAHNALYQKGLVSSVMKINSFADMMTDELNEMLNCFDQGAKPVVPTRVFEPSGKSLPASVDWRAMNIVTPVKDQGLCKSCWAFSATGSLEAQWAMKTGQLLPLSEQQLVDCSRNFSNFGCEGGFHDRAFSYIQSVGGIEYDASYPYTGNEGTCAFNKSSVAATVNGLVQISVGNESALNDAVAHVGPISVGIDAGHDEFYFYAGGVIDVKNCSTTYLNHDVLVVGYGTEEGKDYWLVKNSWGIYRGVDGYYKMSRNKNNQCGIATRASYPLV